MFLVKCHHKIIFFYRKTLKLKYIFTYIGSLPNEIKMCKLCTYAYTKVVYKYMLHGQILESVGVTITSVEYIYK